MPCTREAWREVTEAESTVGTIDRARECLARGDRKGYDKLKRSLPLVCFMATFTPNRGSKGTSAEAPWRSQKHAVLNGLVMMDVDHVSQPTPDPSRGGGEVESLTPVKLFMKIPDHMFDEKTCPTPILLVHVTPSGDGLRIVFKADPNRGNISDNQHYMASALGVTCDEACKDASRGSFVPKAEDILFINENIFDYDNKEFDQKFGSIYRSTGGAVCSENPHSAAGSTAEAGGEPAGTSVDSGRKADEKNTDGGLKYEGINISDIVARYIEREGTPVVGKRHQYLLQMAARLRPLVERNSERLRHVVRTAGFVQDMDAEGAAAEVDRIVADACALKGGYAIGQKLQAVLESLGYRGDDADGQGAAGKEFSDAGCQFWSRLRDCVGEPYSEALQGVDDANKVGALFAAGAMFCTLMTRTWYTHFDGRQQRMNPQVYIIGDPASGKSFAAEMDESIMAAMRAADQPARDAEERYKKEQKARSTSSKAQKGEALKQPEGCIRYLPSRTSNAIFYRRAKNAKEVVGGEVLPLHLYTFDSELDSSITAQSGGSWIGKHDLELKAFHNEVSGVDYANNDSVNQLIPIYYNQVVTGTQISLAKKVTLRNINDGLCSRIAVFRMASPHFQMIARGTSSEKYARQQRLKEWGFFFERQQGELPIQRLVDHVYSLCEAAAAEAEANNDTVMDYLRKRAVFYATWFVVPQIVARLRGQEGKTLQDVEVSDDDLRLSTIIYDAVLYYQDKFFGQMLQESWENAKREFVPRRRNSRFADAYSQLPQEFTVDDVERLMGVTNNAAKMHCSRWVQAGYTKRMKKGNYQKLISDIKV